jgi:hypothetical protein
MNELFNQIKWQILKAKHRDLSALTATHLIETELEAMRQLGIARENWVSLVFMLNKWATWNEAIKN